MPFSACYLVLFFFVPKFWKGGVALFGNLNECKGALVSVFPKGLRRYATVFAPGVGLDSTFILGNVFIAFCRREGDLACAYLDPYFFKGDRSVDTFFLYDGIDLNIYPICIFI